MGFAAGRLRDVAAGLMLMVCALAAPFGASAAPALLNVSYDPTREFYVAYDALFEGRPLAETGALMDAAIKESPDDWRRGEIGANRTEFLKGVGRNAENLASARAAMERDPFKRYASAAAMKAEIDHPETVRLVGRHQHLKRGKQWRRRLRRARLILITALAPILLFLALWFVLSRRGR